MGARYRRAKQRPSPGSALARFLLDRTRPVMIGQRLALPDIATGEYAHRPGERELLVYQYARVVLVGWRDDERIIGDDCPSQEMRCCGVAGPCEPVR